MPAVLFYDVVVFVHVTAIVLAFGVTFAYPVLGSFITRNHPRSVPALHEAQARVGKVLIAPAMVLAFAAGIYLASDRDLFGETWVVVPMVILIVLFGMGGAFFGPTEERAAQAAARDVEAAGDGPVTFSPQYEALAARIANGGKLATVLIVVAIYFMVAKPFA
jgi:uncharacterized membrane protein